MSPTGSGRPSLPVGALPDPAQYHATGPGEPKLISSYSRGEILHIRHHWLFAPRDFDLSPYFRVVKPAIERGFDYKTLVWEDRADESGPS